MEKAGPFSLTSGMSPSLGDSELVSLESRYCGHRSVSHANIVLCIFL